MTSRIEPFSKKQLLALTWWCGQFCDRDAIICDGAIRSGKTMCLSLSFVVWASVTFDGMCFAICGKTLRSVRRNVIAPLVRLMPGLGMDCTDSRGQHMLTVRFGGHENVFYLFGGRDESSAALIQGISLAGVMFDEVALMPRSFVEQALARCSAKDAKFFFNCNPSHPRHWFFEEWIQKADEKNAVYLHFSLDDNPSLSPEVKGRYEALYSGAFYDRFVRGLWVRPDGLVYPMFSEERHVVRALPDSFDEFRVSCDHGTVNPCSMGLWGRCGEVWYRVREFYHDARAQGYSMTDEEYYEALRGLCAETAVSRVVVDPSAASFIELIRRKGEFEAEPAHNDVARGIQRVMEMLQKGRLLFHESCRDAIREFSLYCWNEKKDSPKKQDDHAMDEVRYLAMSEEGMAEDGFYVAAPRRR